MSSSLKLLDRKQRLRLGLFSAGLFGINLIDLGALATLGVVGALASGTEVPGPINSINLDTTVLVVWGTAAVALMFLAKTVLGLLIERRKGLFLAVLEQEATEKIAKQVFDSGLHSFKRNSPADLSFAILHSTGTAFGGILGNALQVFAQLTLSLLIIGFFVFIDWQVALAIILYFAAVVVLFQAATKAISTTAGQKIGEGYSEVSQTLQNISSAYKEMSVLNRLDYFISAVVDSRTKISLAEASQNYLATIPRLIVEMALILGGVSFVGFEIWSNPSEPDFGFLALFVVGSFRMMAAILPLQRSYATLRFLAPQSAAAQQLVSRALEPETANFEALASTQNIELQDPPELGLGVEAQDLSFSYHDGAGASQALSGVSITVEPGTMAAIVGPSGAGKSTLVDLLLGLNSPSSGKILISNCSPAEIRNKFPGLLGYVPQKPGMVSGTIRENVALGLHEEEIDDLRVEAVLEQAALGEWVRSLPRGMRTSLGAHSDSLSGGQMQRIGLARALYHKPRLLVLDEATSALDPDTESLVTTALERLGSSVTRIVVAHRVSTIQTANTVFALGEGTVLGSGSFSQLRIEVPFFDRYIRSLDITE